MRIVTGAADLIFFAVAAKAMRQVLVDHARSSLAQKRGGRVRVVELEEALAATGGKDRDLVALDAALTALAAARFNNRR